MAEIKIAADSGAGSVGLAGPSATTNNAAIQFTLPVADGSAGQCLQTDGSGNLSWVTTGITHYDTWSLTADKNWSGTNYHNADWSRSTSVPSIGSAMSSNSGNMTFPVTGIWEVTFFGQTGDSTENAYTQIWIDYSTDSGSNWTTLANSTDAISDDGSNTVYGATCVTAAVDVTNTSTFLVRFGTANEQGAVFKGNATVLRNYAIFKRIGDT